MDKHKIGKQLKELRLSRGWRQSDVADKVGLSRPAVCNIESGKRAMTLSTLKRFCEIYSIDVSFFDIETDNFNEAIDLTTRIEKIFKSDIPDEKKDDLYKQIMRLYLMYRQ